MEKSKNIEDEGAKFKFKDSRYTVPAVLLYNYLYNALTYMKQVAITSTVKKYPKNIPFEEMTKKIMGARYNLSLAFIGAQRAQRLNEAYRKKSYSPNVLSFPLDAHNGEIFICPATSDKEAKNFNLSKKGYVAFLVIHGLLHLKGYDHGDTMDKMERKYVKAFNIK